MIVTQSRNNLIDFEIATNPDYIPNWHHEAISKELEHIEKYGDRDYKILIVTVPPRAGKSQMCSIDFPTWYLGRNPKNEIITASYSADLAQEFGGKAREKMDSDEYKAIFPEVSLREDERARGKWKTQQGGSYVAVGVGGGLTGRGANCLLIDDPVKNREEAESEVYRQKIWDWFTSTAFTRLSPRGVVIVIQTRWHTDDLAGKILAHPELSKRTKVMSFPAIAEHHEKPHRLQGEALWPSRYDLKALAEIKSTLGPYDFSALYQCSPVLLEDREFNPKWFKYIYEYEVAAMNCRRFLTIDTAMSKKAQADSTGFCDNRVNSENFWNIKAWQMKIGPEELIDTIFSLHAQNHYEAIGIEKTAYTDGLKPYLDQEQRKRNKFLPIVELKHKQTAKETRIRGLIPLYASGTIFHLQGECTDLEQQMAHFPSGAHDDILDSLAYMLQIADGAQSSNVSIYVPTDF